MRELTEATSPLVRHRLTIGVLAGAVTVLIWALWIVTTRQAAAVHIPPVWLGIIRFSVPAVALAPFWWRVGLLPRGVDPRLVAIMVAGAGAPFFVLVATGMHYASAAESGVLLGGTMPLFAAVFSAFIDRERFGASRLAGFALVVAAMAAIGGAALVMGQGPGRLLVVLGAAFWAGYTLAFRRSGLSAMPAAGIVAAWST
ncbi:MAG: DMT family transporter, partial [Bauldia sp.]|nr:DMT family transporter [Bauldia sp.]